MKIRSALVALTIVAALSATACAAATSEESSTPATENHALKLTTRTADEVSGTYSENDAELGFHLYREGDVRFAVPHVIDSVLVLGVLGGRLVEHGAVYDDATLEGDKAALDDMLELPEAKLVAPLKDALAEAGVNPFLIDARRRSRQEACNRTPSMTATGGISRIGSRSRSQRGASGVGRPYRWSRTAATST